MKMSLTQCGEEQCWLVPVPVAAAPSCLCCCLGSSLITTIILWQIALEPPDKIKGLREKLAFLHSKVKHRLGLPESILREDSIATVLDGCWTLGAQ
jgi:hypothetical protein